MILPTIKDEKSTANTNKGITLNKILQFNADLDSQFQ